MIQLSLLAIMRRVEYRYRYISAHFLLTLEIRLEFGYF